MTAVVEKEPSLAAQVKGELHKICESQGGIVKPDDVVVFAKRKKNSAIRKWMDSKGAFDPKKAIEEYPKILARQLIVKVKVFIPDGAGDVFSVRAFTSLDDDRKDGSGYRPILSVLSDDEMMARMEATFARELHSFEKRYALLTRVSKYRPVFDAIRRINAAG